MTKLHQILAVERDVRRDTDRRITDGYQLLQKPILIQGISRTYRPLADDGEQFPAESTKVQVRVNDVLTESRMQFERLWDIVATKDFANCDATANVILDDGTVIIAAAPATYLLWLEKQLHDLHTTMQALPILEASEDWTFSPEQNVYVTPVVQTHKSKKVPRVMELSAPTREHPAQVTTWQEDIVVGNWSTTKFSAALPAVEVRALVDRVLELQRAVKTARAQANEIEIVQQRIAAAPLDYIFTGQARAASSPVNQGLPVAQGPGRSTS